MEVFCKKNIISKISKYFGQILFEKGKNYKIKVFDSVSYVINYEFYMFINHIYGSHRVYLKNRINEKFLNDSLITIFENHFIDLKQDRKEKLNKINATSITSENTY